MIRQTSQRSAVFEAFAKSGRPLTAEEVFELARESVPALGLRTVYRHLKALLGENRIISTDYPGQPIRYELVDGRGSRPHFICRRCRRLFDLPVAEPEVAFPEVPGFRFEGHEVVFYGHCPECLEARRAARRKN